MTPLQQDLSEKLHTDIVAAVKRYRDLCVAVGIPMRERYRDLCVAVGIPMRDINAGILTEFTYLLYTSAKVAGASTAPMHHVIDYTDAVLKSEGAKDG